MKIKKFTMYFLGFALLVLILNGCKKDDDDDGDTSGSVTITLLSPTVPAEGLTPEIGDVIEFQVIVHADDGLSELLAGTEQVKAYAGVETDDTAEYNLLIRSEDDILLELTVKDAFGESASLDVITINPLPGEGLGLLIADMGGEMISSQPGLQDEWDTRTEFTFKVVGDVTDEAVSEIVNTEAVITFAADNPDGPGNVMKMVKKPPEDFTGNSWLPPGGWVHQLVDLGELIPEADAQAVVDGDKVIKMDVYYDATVTSAYVMDSITTIADRYGSQPWGADVSQGYLIVCILANKEKHMVDYDNNGYLISMKGYFTTENEWITLEFDAVDTDRSTKWDPSNDLRALSNEIDMVHFIVSGGYEEQPGVYNENPIYFKNLRIVDAD